MNLNSTLFIQFLVFFIFVGFTKKFIWPPLIEALDNRKKKISDILASANSEKEKLSHDRKRIHEELIATHEENKKRINLTEKQCKLIIEKSKKTATEEANLIFSNARIEIIQQINIARENLHNEIVNLAIKSAEKILNNKITIEVNSNLLNQLKTEL
ncbi:F0F1 ATP synthase subunit B [Candidatus Profftella armatura (Diaphorina cf. continua)]|uniref:ATP synthase subunit b n=1 Tax=Candidatus Profftella armatura (Diaphorina cf. continua) TaxID=2661583 RepID=A0A7R6VYS4_9PROT|nr:F0F1 ATP synthase subunit B [Candidatus Profftella armatura (Diaphorina cf. continua)]BCG49627.1 F0F1 ATP synthase subunit B [Candidatus Profftella armatura (Diaphorina cf. continua)]